MDQFLKIYLKLSQLTQNEMNNLNGPIAIKKIEFIMKYFSGKKILIHVFYKAKYTKHLNDEH